MDGGVSELLPPQTASGAGNGETGVHVDSHYEPPAIIFRSILCVRQLLYTSV